MHCYYDDCTYMLCEVNPALDFVAMTNFLQT